LVVRTIVRSLVLVFMIIVNAEVVVAQDTGR
jgi:hypothetical protein